MKYLAAACLLCFVTCLPSVSSPGLIVSPKYSKQYSTTAFIVAVDDQGSVVGAGSGTILIQRRLVKLKILTCKHITDQIVQRKLKAFAYISGYEKKISMYVDKVDPVHDLAILTSDYLMAKSGPEVKIAKEEPMLGDRIVIIGAPGGRQLSVSQGIISASSIDGKTKFYWSTAASYFGSSGGGVYNEDKELVGVLVGAIMVRALSLREIVKIPLPLGTRILALPHIRAFLKSIYYQF